MGIENESEVEQDPDFDPAHTGEENGEDDDDDETVDGNNSETEPPLTYVMQSWSTLLVGYPKWKVDADSGKFPVGKRSRKQKFSAYVAITQDHL